MPNQRQSPRVPLHLKPTACSEANSRPTADPISKQDDRRSPRSPNHGKKVLKVADLETKLAQAQEELKKLKEQLASAETAKRDAQVELEETKKLFPVTPPNTASQDLVEVEKEKTINVEEDKLDEEVSLREEDEALPVEDNKDLLAEDGRINFPTTDVFEVTSTKVQVEGLQAKEDAEQGTVTQVLFEVDETKDNAEKKVKEQEEAKSKLAVGLQSQAIAELRSILEEKMVELERLVVENDSLRKEADEAKADSAAAKEKAEEMATKLAGAKQKLAESNAALEQMGEKLESEESLKVSLEAEMKRLRVQTEQWRKAAEAAASVLAAGDAEEFNGRRVVESCRSMDGHLRDYDISTGGGGWSPAVPCGDIEDGMGGGKRRSGGGIRVFGDLWKKKGQQK